MVHRSAQCRGCTPALCGIVALMFVIPSWLQADEGSRFLDEVQPLLVAKCIACHGPEKQEGGLRLDSLTAARAGGDRGPAIVPGNADKSLFVRAIAFGDPDLQMPPKQKLSDKEIVLLTEWIKSGAAWPEPVAVLFEDEPQFLAALSTGNGKVRLIAEDAFAGKAALGVTPLQRDGARIPNWKYPIRENPKPGEYRYLRLAWKKRGAGSVMLELASDGHWPDAKVARGRYVAGPNTTGWAALSVGNVAPSEWTLVTFDLWKDLGDFMLTGCAPTCDQGEEAFFDSLILAPSRDSLAAYRPGFGQASPSAPDRPPGDAFTDKQNPIRKLFRGERLDLWSLKKPVKRDLPPGAIHPVDAFLQEQLTLAGLHPAPEADRRTLIRRLTLDLTGLPPTPAEVDAFCADTTPQAYGNLVKRLLESPRYGERQAQLWLDVVRYADTNGYERDEFRPLIWQYRDYVIRAFNQDKPFAKFIREQLAGDELVVGAPKSAAEADALIATGYLRLGQWDSTASIFQEENRLRAEVLADLTNTTASAFLGLTMSCCQCHDHKYDPLSQADHYRLRAFFAGVVPRDDMPISLADEQAAINQHNAELDRLAAPLKDELAKVAKEDPRRLAELKAKIAEIDSRRRQPRRAMGATESGPSPPATHLLYQGDFASPRQETSPGFVSVLNAGPAIIEPPHSGTSGRRLALANWFTSQDNPWTARVIVNRIWQQHFGVGIVATPNDFGYSGAWPTHLELLDWLAIQFVRSGWSLKELHRLIVTSAAYRQSSRETADLRRLDPDNRLLGRQNVRRLDAEMLRDSLLACSGLLKPYEFGKPLWPPVPEELRKAQPAILEAEKGGDGGRMQGWYADPIEQTDVRSVFLVRKRCLPIPFLQAFDLPDTTTSCARRDATVVAPQALMLLNSPESIRYAQAFASRVAAPSDKPVFTDARQAKPLIDRAFLFSLARKPTDDEQQLSIAFLKSHSEKHAAAGERAGLLALVDLCRAILNLNEFAYID